MAAEQPIPVYTNLNDLYGNLGNSLDHVSRWNNLAQEFARRFGRAPEYIARAPGRVNLIGEHIDYALFGVFPAAIEHDILIACAPRPILPHPHHSPGNVIAENMHHKYTRQVFAPTSKTRSDSITKGGLSEASSDNFDLEREADGTETVHIEGWHLDIDTKQLRWESYVKAGYYGVLNHYFTPSKQTAGQSQPATHSHPVPVDLLFTGSVPAGSGLSSSAAMVVASTLAFLAVNGKLDDTMEHKLTKGDLVRMAVENEKRVGVNSGGMDQAASVISLPASALYITFHPTLAAYPVPLPPGAVLVCANSLVVSDKVVHARTRYNLRVVETLVAARVLARALNVPVAPYERVTLREVVGRFLGEDVGGLGGGGGVEAGELSEALERMEREVEALRPTRGLGLDGEQGVTMEEMVEASGLDETEFKETYLSWVDVEATHFQLYKRAKHVFSEAKRVLQFRATCLGADSKGDAVLIELGRLMDESQASCRDLFECSCPELDELTRIAKEAGAYGSRLTGAGWGGCTVSLVAESEVEEFIVKMQEGYAPFRKLEGDALRDVLFATKPSSGACVYKFN